MPFTFSSLGLSLATRKAGAVVSDRRLEPRLQTYLAHRFLVEIEGLIIGNFAEIAGLQAETEVFEYREGGSNKTPRRFAGATKYPPLVLKTGMSPLDGLWAWHRDVVAGSITRRNGTIYLVDSHLVPLVWWNFEDAFPVKWTGPALQASAAAVAFETVEIAHQGLSRPRLKNLAGGIAGEAIARVKTPGSFF